MAPATSGITWGVFSDISDVKRSQERLDFLTHHDLLTSLPNRLLFNDHLNHGIARARRNGRQLAVLFVDLDHFKNVNDTLGYDLGDELLKKIAGYLGAHVRKSDTLARIGGDEFILLLDDVEVPCYAGAVAEKILGLLSQGCHQGQGYLFCRALPPDELLALWRDGGLG